MGSWKSVAAGLVLVAASGLPWGWSQEKEPKKEEEPKLLGRCTPSQLGEEPYSEWFREGHDGYEPNPEIVRRLAEVDREGLAITVFFGTWCGDSRREVPRLVKLLEVMEFPEEAFTLVAVDNTDEAIKRSPDGEERGREVYRVPTIVVSRDGREVARMVEHPILSLERDLLSIFSGEPYEPNYTSYPTVRRWLREGLLSDENVSPHGLAGQVRHEIRAEGELAAAAGVLLSRGESREALKLYRVNCALYPESSRAFERLAKALFQVGETEEARETAEKALRLDPDPERVKGIVELLATSAG